MENIFYFVFILGMWGWFWYFVKKLIWKNIRESASIYASHYDITLDPFGEIRFKINKETPWVEQSYSYHRLLGLLDVLVEAFALGCTLLETALVRSLLPHVSPFWDVARSSGVYVVLFLPTYFWGASWILKIVTELLHFPKHELPLPNKPSLFLPLLTAALISGLFTGINLHYVRSDTSLFSNLLLATLFSTLRLVSIIPKGKFSLPSDTYENFLENCNNFILMEDRRERIADVCALPNMQEWLDSLPWQVRHVAASILEGSESISLLTKADVLEPEEIHQYPFVLTLLHGNPETLPLNLVRVLRDIREAVKGFGNQGEKQK